MSPYTTLEEILDLSKKFITLPSTKDNQDRLDQIISLASNQLSEFTQQKFLSNGKPSLLVHNSTPETKHFRIIFNAHLDVVAGDKKHFKPEIKGDKLYGRGAYDMKSGAAVMLLVFRELAKTIKYSLALQLVTDEEIGGQDGTKYQIGKGITADFVIAGENTDFKIITKAKSPLWIKLKIKGKTAHGAYPWLGENALLKTYFTLQKLFEKYPLPKQPAWQTTINISKIETPNNTFNKVPDECTVWLDIRVIPEDKKTILKTIKQNLPKDTEIKVVVDEMISFTDPTHPFIISLQNTIQKLAHNEGEITGTNGASDVRFFNEKFMPGVEFGPKGANAHADNEWVDIPSLNEYHEILKRFLLSVE